MTAAADRQRAPVRGADPGPEDVVTPAPWVLTGTGLILVLRTPRAARANGSGRLTTLALVDYASSDVGPYRELLRIPGVARLGGAIGPSVDRIWVTLHASAISGNVNWGLSKTVASIDRVPLGDGRQGWHAEDEQGLLAAVTHRPIGPRLPVWKPARFPKLLQARGEQRFRTPVGFVGAVRAARVEAAAFDPARLADLEAGAEVVAALTVEHGTLTFGRPELRALGERG